MTETSHLPGCFIASGSLQLEETGAEVIVFDPSLDAFHLLNATAYGILKACNGSNSTRDIALALRSTFGVDDLDAVIGDVAETLESLREKGLVHNVVPARYAPRLPAEADAERPLVAVSVTGMSMFPVLLSGDKVLVKHTSAEELAKGDIIAWPDRSGRLIVHRIHSLEMSANPPRLTTKGDFSAETDQPVAADQVLGKVVAVLREGSVQWLRALEAVNGAAAPPAERTERPPLQHSFYKELKVLDLRDVSVDSIREIGSVENVGVVLLSPRNAEAWQDVSTKQVTAVMTVPDDYRVYTGQPELLPEVLNFLPAPLRMVVSGQLFLTEFEPHQIPSAISALILSGQVYVGSEAAKSVLEPLTTIVSGEICIVPQDHRRWIGSAILGPEYAQGNGADRLVVVGELVSSPRIKGSPRPDFLFHKAAAGESRAPANG